MNISEPKVPFSSFEKFLAFRRKFSEKFKKTKVLPKKSKNKENKREMKIFLLLSTVFSTVLIPDECQGNGLEQFRILDF